VFLILIELFIVGQAFCTSHYVSKFWEEPPFSGVDFLLQAELLKQHGEVEQALDIYYMLFQWRDLEPKNWSAIFSALAEFSNCGDFPVETPWGRLLFALCESDKNFDTSVVILRDLNQNKIPVISSIADYWRGTLMFRHGFYDSAYSVFMCMLQTYPEIPVFNELLFRLGYIKFIEGEFGISDSFFAGALYSEDNEDLQWWRDEAYFFRTICLVKLGELDSARLVSSEISSESPYFTRISKIIDEYADSLSIDESESIPRGIQADVLIQRGWRAMDRRRFSNALNLFENASEASDGVSQEAIIFSAEAAYNVQDYTKAIKLYEMIDDTMFVDYAIWGKGWSLIRIRKFDEARSALKTLAEKSFFRDHVKYAIANSYFLQRDYGTAERLFEEYFEDCQFYCSRALYRMFLSQIFLREIDRAIATAQQYALKYPRSSSAVRLGLILSQKLYDYAMYGEILDVPLRIAERFQNDASDSIVLYAEKAKYAMGVYDDPIEIFDGFLNKRPERQTTRLLALEIAQQFEEIGREQDAIYLYTKARYLSTNSDSLWAKALLSLITINLKKNDTLSALDIFDELVEVKDYPWVPAAMLAFGRWHRENDQNIEKSIAVLSKIKDKYFGTTIADSAILEMAISYSKIEDYNKSVALLNKRLSKINPENPLFIDFTECLVNNLWSMGLGDSAASITLNMSTKNSDFACKILTYGCNESLDNGYISNACIMMREIEKLDCQNLTLSFLFRMAQAYAAFDSLKSDANRLLKTVIENSNDDILAEKARKFLFINSDSRQ